MRVNLCSITFGIHIILCEVALYGRSRSIGDNNAVLRVTKSLSVKKLMLVAAVANGHVMFALVAFGRDSRCDAVGCA